MGSGIEQLLASHSANNEEVSLKVSHGNEIRRITLQGTSYAHLCDKIAELFGFDRAALSLKYQDDDGDKISMSSDLEFREAVRLSKQMTKVLRLFIELRVPDKKVEQQQANPEVRPDNKAEAKVKAEDTVYLGPSGRYGLPRKYQPFSAPNPSYSTTTHSQGAFHPLSYGPWGGVAEGKHHGPEHHRHHYYRHSPHDRSAHHSINATHGAFSPATTFPFAEENVSSDQLKQHWREERKQYKESKKAMKESWKAMKRETVTVEDKEALKELKEKMKNEMRQAKSELLADVKYNQDTLKALKHSEKENRPRLVARHVEDVTIPDGTELPPSTPFIKTWKIRNEGPAWPTGSQLLFVSRKGDNLNGPERVVIKGDVLPGQEVEVSVPLITPSEPGRYIGYYRMVTPEGVKFGQRVWVSFVVRRESDITPTSTLPTTTSTATTTTSVAKVCDSVDA